MHSLAIVFFMLSTFWISSSVEQPSYEECDVKKSKYTPNSPFENNLKTILESLLEHTPIRGFYNTSISTGSDPVYGQALCRGDINRTVCQKCVGNANKEIMKNCTVKEAFYWYELCQIQYSYYPNPLSGVYTGKFPATNNNEKDVSDSGFPAVLKNFMNELSSKGVSSKLRFATGKIKWKVETIYGLVQCTRDVHREACGTCLNRAVNELGSCCKRREGGTVFSRNCNVRFQLYKFYENSPTEGNKAGDGMKIWVVVAIVVLACVLVVLICCYVFQHRKKKATQRDEDQNQDVMLNRLATQNNLTITEEPNLEELHFMELSIIMAATNNFSNSNKLGYGGFGSVYKGVLPNGKEIAVKRLSRKSRQGLDEFKNEIILMAKLQHRNLVRLLGCGIEGDEKLLLYEFMPNNSLDVIIFDSEKRSALDWDKRLGIIDGIARGLLYLHEDSRHKIIHRDLKPSNVLLDHEMVAKISDFGMARIFGEDQNTANTRRIVGTYGYMAPEYAMEGLFSVKSDVFSFGVILLEIISGKKNSGFHLTCHAQTLLDYAWRLWNDGQEKEFVDPFLIESCCMEEVVKCIHIGLLCVQENPAERPTMSSVLLLLGSETIELPQPRQPAFSVGRVVRQIDQSSSTDPCVNQLTLSGISPR